MHVDYNDYIDITYILYIFLQFAIELQSIGVSDRILSRIAKYFLSPPILSPYYYATGAE